MTATTTRADPLAEGSWVAWVDAPRTAETSAGVVAVPSPALSWVTSTDEPSWMQRAVEIQVQRTPGTTGTATEVVRLAGSASVRVPWPFPPLQPRERATLRVRVLGPGRAWSAWSPPTAVLAGFLDDGEWSAALVGAGDERPHLLRSTFHVAEGLDRAVLYSTSHGVHDVELNGARADDEELKPGWTSYQWRMNLVCREVTDLVRPGRNAVGIVLAGGWYTERWGFRDAAAQFYPGTPAAAAQLVLHYRDGSTQTVATGPEWVQRTASTRSSSLYQGEDHDARIDRTGWSTAEFDDGDWSPVVVATAPAPTPTPRTTPPVRVVAHRSVVGVVTTPQGGTVLDFGQNLVGVVRFRVLGPRGTEVVLRHAEVLEHGELGTRPLRNAAATDRYVLRGDPAGEEWRPRWTFHGFRYVQVEGWPGDLDPTAFTAEVISSDLRRTGRFRTSHPLVQKLHDNVVWSMRGNFLSVPTDCPQRDERLGWTGDLQVFAPAAAYLFDTDEFLRSWLRDVVAEQQAADGVVPMVVPAVIPQVPGASEPVAAWGDAITVVPAVLHEAFADIDTLRECYPGMLAWVELLRGRAGDDLLWEGGIQFGDWLDPDAPPDQPGRAAVDPDLVATAYFARSAELAARAAGLLGEHADEHRLGELARAVTAAFREAYVTPRGRMMSDAPTAYALAIAFELVDPDTAEAMGGRLAELVRRRAYRISTGFVGTPLVCDALLRTGRAGAAARLLLQTECPSWLYPVEQGATTIWERWDSMLEDGSINPGQMTSFNHYALGAVVDVLHRHVAGLAPAGPAYRRLRMAPAVLTGLSDARAELDSPYGYASAGWSRLAGGLVEVEVIVPPNTTAEVVLPSGDRHEVGSGRHCWVVGAPEEQADLPATWGLDSNLADVIDSPEVYRAAMAALDGVDPQRADDVRRSTRWTAGRTLRQVLDKAPRPVVDAVARALHAQ